MQRYKGHETTIGVLQYIHYTLRECVYEATAAAVVVWLATLSFTLYFYE